MNSWVCTTSLYWKVRLFFDRHADVVEIYSVFAKNENLRQNEKTKMKVGVSMYYILRPEHRPISHHRKWPMCSTVSHLYSNRRWATVPKSIFSDWCTWSTFFVPAAVRSKYCAMQGRVSGLEDIIFLNERTSIRCAIENNRRNWTVLQLSCHPLALENGARFTQAGIHTAVYEGMNNMLNYTWYARSNNFYFELQD